jgi:hypothetical protein
MPSPNSPAKWPACLEYHVNYQEVGRAEGVALSHLYIVVLGEAEAAAGISYDLLEREET